MKLFSKVLLKSKYKLNIYYSDKEINFLFDDLDNSEIKIYKLYTSLEKLCKENDDFSLFKTTSKLIKVINTCLESSNFSIEIQKNHNLQFEIKSDFFNNGSIKISIPEIYDFKSPGEIDSLKQYISIYKSQSKEDAAIKSFKGTEILDDLDKILISKWIHPHKIIKFNLLYSTKDGDSSSTFHYYCDGIFPTLVVVKEDSSYKMIFGGYSTHTWQVPNGSSGYYSKAPDSFLFNLTKKEKYELTDNLSNYAVYRHSSYGPIFGYSNSNADLYLYNGSTCYCNKYSYNTGSYNLLGKSGQTSFSYKVYEVYQVIFE